MNITSWEKLESASQALLADWQRTRQLFFHRFYDTKSAGNLLPAQPADFLVTYLGYTVYVDTKFSAKSDSLRACFSSNVKSHQTAAAKLARRAGAGYWFLFYSRPARQFELWDGLYCMERRHLGRPLESTSARRFLTLEDAWTAAITLNLN